MTRTYNPAPTQHRATLTHLGAGLVAVALGGAFGFVLAVCLLIGSR